MILLCMLAIFAGQSNSAQQPKSTRILNPAGVCGLVTKAEIEEAIGTSIGYGVPQMAREADVCTYSDPKGTKVNVLLSRSKKPRDLSKAVEQAKKGVPDATVREIPGLGDKALLVESPAGPTMFSIYHGGDALVVSVYGLQAGPKTEAAAEKIARKAFKHIPPAAPAK